MVGCCLETVTEVHQAFLRLNSSSQLPTGKLGTHSIRKGAATFASRNGIPRDWIQQRVGGEDTTPRIMVKLSKRPPDLHVLWREYEFGLKDGQKPAREYTSIERGANKASYCCRKKFWDLVDLLIGRGSDSDTAIDRIYGVYGKSSTVTKILTS